MKEEKYYPIIKVALLHEWDDVLGMNLNGEPIFSHKFLMRLEEKTNDFKRELDEKIHQLKGENSFIHFTEMGRNIQGIDEYIVQINARDVAMEMFISGIIEMTITNIKFHFKHSKNLYE